MQLVKNYKTFKRLYMLQLSQYQSFLIYLIAIINLTHFSVLKLSPYNTYKSFFKTKEFNGKILRKKSSAALSRTETSYRPPSFKEHLIPPGGGAPTIAAQTMFICIRYSWEKLVFGLKVEGSGTNMGKFLSRFECKVKQLY